MSMDANTRAIVAAAAFAYVAGQKVGGIYDHSTGRDLRIAAELQGDRLQGFDGDRAVKFGGTIPELHVAGNKGLVSFEIDGPTVKGYDRSSSNFFEATVTNGVVQLYDHGQSAWFAYDVQDPSSKSSYHRDLARH